MSRRVSACTWRVPASLGVGSSPDKGTGGPSQPPPPCPQVSSIHIHVHWAACCGAPKPGESQVGTGDPAPAALRTLLPDTELRISAWLLGSHHTMSWDHARLPSAHGRPLTASCQPEAQHARGCCPHSTPALPSTRCSTPHPPTQDKPPLLGVSTL